MSALFREGERVTKLVPPRIQCLMTGVMLISIAHPRYCLHYEDGQTEAAVCPEISGHDVFAIVSAVQSRREDAR